MAAVATVCMMLLTTADASGRYLFNRPILAAYELTTNYLMIVGVFLALPYAYRQGANIRVTFLVERLGRRARLVVDWGHARPPAQKISGHQGAGSCRVKSASARANPPGRSSVTRRARPSCAQVNPPR